MMQLAAQIRSSVKMFRRAWHEVKANIELNWWCLFIHIAIVNDNAENKLHKHGLTTTANI
jgi:hypothetical protein